MSHRQDWIYEPYQEPETTREYRNGDSFLTGFDPDTRLGGLSDASPTIRR